MALYIELVDLLLLIFMSSMSDVLKRSKYRDLLISARQGLLIGAAAILYLFFLQQGQFYSRLALILMIVVYVILAFAVREAWKIFLLRRIRKNSGRSLMVITSREMAPDVIRDIREKSYMGFSLAGLSLIDEPAGSGDVDGVKIVSSADDVPEYLCQEWVDEVLVTLPESCEYPRGLMERIAETGVVVHYDLGTKLAMPGSKHFIENIGDYTVVTNSINYASPWQLFVKRLMDIAIGAIGCIFTGVLFLFVAPVIYIKSPGPVFYSQERVGKNGRKFKMHKFRSMYLDADERKAELLRQNKVSDGRMFKMDFDPRVIGNELLPDGTQKTGIGDFIRRTSLDEFPQFFNVLKGEMSVVGTRPPLESETSLYELHHRARLAIKPGITGMWQVSGRSNITDFEEVVKLDRQYIDNWSIGLDLRILFKTILVVVRHEGSV